MATRFYLSDTAAEVTPAANGTWDDTDGASNKKLVGHTPSGTAMVTGTTISWSSGQTAIDRRYVSEPLSADYTITGSCTIKCQIRAQELVSNDNSVPYCEVYAVSNDGSSVIGTIMSIANWNTITELPTSLTNQPVIDFTVESGLALSAGHRLVVVLGYFASGTTPQGASRYGDSLAVSDLPEDSSTTTDLRPWIQFSEDIPVPGKITTSVIGSSSSRPSPSVVGHVHPSAAETSSSTPSPAVGGGVSLSAVATTSTVPNDHEIEHDGISLDAAIDTTSATQSPSVGGGVSLDVIATSSTAPQPTLSGFVSLDAVATTSTTQQPSVDGYLALSAVSTTSTTQQPLLVGYVETGATSTTLTVQTHTLEAVIAPSATSTSSTTQSPSVDGVVTLSAVGTTSTTNDPSLGGGVSLDVIATTATIQTHLIAETVVRVHDATIDTAAASASATINTAPGRRSVSVGTGAASASATIETE